MYKHYDKIPYYNQKCGRCDQSAMRHDPTPKCKEFVFNQAYYEMCKAQSKLSIYLLSQAGTHVI